MWKRFALSAVCLVASSGLFAESLEEIMSKEIVAVGNCTSQDGFEAHPCARLKDGEDFILVIFGENNGELVPALAIKQKKGSWEPSDQKTVWRNPIFFPVSEA